MVPQIGFSGESVRSGHDHNAPDHDSQAGTLPDTADHAADRRAAGSQADNLPGRAAPGADAGGHGRSATSVWATLLIVGSSIGFFVMAGLNLWLALKTH